jgi:hypothetical protein
MFERDPELVEKGILKAHLGEARMFDEQGDGNLAKGVMIQVDLCRIGAVDVFLRRDHSGRVT